MMNFDEKDKHEDEKDADPQSKVQKNEEEEKTALQSENINLKDLMTSSPLMNKKKMFQHVKDLNKEKDKQDTF